MPPNLKPYPAYKPSGVEWLGDVPEHWIVCAVKRSYEIQLGKMLQTAPQTPNDKAVPYLKALHVQWFSVQTADPPTMWANPREVTQFGIQKGDLLVCEGGEGGRSGIVRADVDDCIIQNALHRIRPKSQALNHYLQYAMYVAKAYGWFDVLNGKATIAHFTKDKLAAFPIPLPPLPEQRAIVRYLDYMDERIRRYVTAKEKLVALLEEERQAVVNHAVTRGLDPNIPLKPSGVEWLGDVPEHWEVCRLKSMARIRYGLGQPPPESPDGLPLIRATNIARGIIYEKDLIFVDPDGVPSGRDATLRSKEIIVVRSGAYTADSAIIPEEYAGAISGYDMVVTATRARPEFIALGLLSTYVRDDQLIVASSRAAQPHLNAEELGNAIFLVPPADEQVAIVRHVESATAPIDTTIARARRQIKLVEEYRTRLIADVVTGKLDVREAAAQLPDEADDSPAGDLDDAMYVDTAPAEEPATEKEVKA